MGFTAMSNLIRFVFFPFTICGAFICGLFVAGWSAVSEMMGIRPFAKLFGQTFGKIVLEVSGKAEYYRKKQAYFELAFQKLQATGGFEGNGAGAGAGAGLTPPVLVANF